MTKSEIIDMLAKQQVQRKSELGHKDIELAVKIILKHMSNALANGDRIEIRRFGSFCLHYRQPRIGRNPKSGEPVQLPGKHSPHFKPSREMRIRVDNNKNTIFK